MEVVSLRRLESQHNPTAPKKSVFYLVPKMMTVGVFLAVILIVATIKIENRPKDYGGKVSHQPAHVYSTKGPIQSDRATINPEQIAPDSNSRAIVFANKFLEELPPPTPDCKAVPCVALTFDDGPDGKSTALILDALESNFAHATFFELGNKVAGQEELLRRMEDDNDDIGNHSWSHPSFLKLTKEQIKEQVSKTQKAIEASGVSAPMLMRPPYGDFLLSMKPEINMAVILWNVDPKDWAYKNPAKIAEIVKKQIKPGAIIVMHDKLTTAQAISLILRDLKAKYRFVTVSQLLNLQPGAKGAYVGR